MYTVYEKILVIRKIIEDYAQNQKKNYEFIISNLQEQVNNIPLDINSNQTFANISRLQNMTGALIDYYNDYQNALKLLTEIDNIINSHKEHNTNEEDKLLFAPIINNPIYQKIIDEIAFNLFIDHNPHLEDLKMDWEIKIYNLNKEYESNKLTKEELIFYTIICIALTQNKDYAQYIKLKEQEKVQQNKQL